LNRLQQIKTDWIEEAETYKFRQLALEIEDIEWHIEQVEKVKALEKANEILEKTLTTELHLSD
jgi:hypothetical protein